MSTAATSAPHADLDAILARHRGDAPVVTLFGRTWRLKPGRPVSLVLSTLKALEDGIDQQFDYAKESELTASLLAEGEYDELLTLGLDEDQRSALLVAATAVHGGEDPHAAVERWAARRFGDGVDAEGEPEAPTE